MNRIHSLPPAIPRFDHGPPAKPAGLQIGIASDASALGYAPPR
jgi:hypothetical protein